MILTQIMGHSHLRVKDTGIRLHNTDSLIKSLQCIGYAFLIRNHCRQIELQILRLQLRRKVVANAVTLPTGDLNIVSRGSEITDDGRALAAKVSRPKIAANKDDSNGFGLFIGDGEEGLGWVAVYELDTEDLGRGE